MRLAPMISLALLLAASPALAQEPPASPPGAAWHHHFDKKRFEARLDDLEAKLQLTAAQQPLWDAYINVRRAQFQAKIAQFKDWQEQKPLDVPARLDRRLAMLNAQISDIQQEKQALGPLWAALDPGQRDILNQATAWHPHHHPWGQPRQGTDQ